MVSALRRVNPSEDSGECESVSANENFKSILKKFRLKRKSYWEKYFFKWFQKFPKKTQQKQFEFLFEKKDFSERAKSKDFGRWDDHK